MLNSATLLSTGLFVELSRPPEQIVGVAIPAQTRQRTIASLTLTRQDKDGAPLDRLTYHYGEGVALSN